ncbi:hypothetical protein PTSG_01752 [Salpingoeca rosetta]|uniref:Lanthionine synthetase C family protein n=1 Tax=Salpingoeca rosetta (strain ATCC 50818 / BSB-021) TaxID=946362 RepID=F2TYV1_SALR5|nr:uncharacterized protein PTSG_01752 [Salpingoeca rosetta]EGD78775.1 hypothetical protein PTSG_01752 [Salpingoeca rosetta]|eukprot:XP_004997731.1 hypothetical protein PTSG_01752 [Salpingoeca rosetta]
MARIVRNPRRFYRNPFLNHSGEELEQAVSSPDALQTLGPAALSRLVERLILPQFVLDGEGRGTEASRYGSVYVGMAGLALLLFDMGITARESEEQVKEVGDEERPVFGDGNSSFDYWQRAADIVPQALERISPRRLASFLEGRAGCYALHAATMHRLGSAAAAEASAKQLCNLWDKGEEAQQVRTDEQPDGHHHHHHQHQHRHRHTVPVSEMAPGECELLYGRAGYLYALLFVHKHCSGGSGEVEGVHLISEGLVRAVVHAIIQEGARNGSRDDAPFVLTYFWHDSLYLGAAHGIAGILLTLLQAREMFPGAVTDDELVLILSTATQLARYRFRNGNYPSSYGSDKDDKVQWCHGAPGVIPLLLRVARDIATCPPHVLEQADVLRPAEYVRIAQAAADLVWKQGVLLKGLGLCHGVGGNGLALLAMYRETGQPIYLHRARAFAHVGLKSQEQMLLVPDRPYSLFEGAGGLAALMLALQSPQRAHFPAYEL